MTRAPLRIIYLDTSGIYTLQNYYVRQIFGSFSLSFNFHSSGFNFIISSEILMESPSRNKLCPSLNAYIFRIPYIEETDKIKLHADINVPPTFSSEILGTNHLAVYPRAVKHSWRKDLYIKERDITQFLCSQKKTSHRSLNRFCENNGGNKGSYCYPLNLYPDIIALINCYHVQFSPNRMLEKVTGG